MKKIGLGVLLFVTQMGLAQDSPFTKFRNESCALGLKDKTGKEILAADYRKIRVESIGNDWLISAEKNDRGTYLLYQNGKAIPLKYRELEKFNEKWIRVESEDKQGLVSTDGKGIALMQYRYIRPVGAAKQYAVTHYEGKVGVLGSMGETLLPNEFDELKYWESADQFLVQKNNIWSRYDSKGKKLEGSYTSIGFTEGAIPYLSVGKGEKRGLIDREGNLIVPIKYNGTGSFPNGWIKLEETYGEWKLLDRNLKSINDNTYKSIYHLPLANCFSVTKPETQKIGLLDDKGEEIVPAVYNMTLTTANGDVIILEKQPNELHIYDNKNKKWLSQKGIQKVLVFSEEDNFFWIKNDQNEWLLVDTTLKPIWDEKYKNVTSNAGNYANVTGENNLVGLFSHKTQQLILPREYTGIQVRGDIFKVRKAGTGWYYVNDKNERLDCK